MKINILYNSSYNFLLINLNHNLCSRYVWFSLFLQCSKKENIRSQWKKIILDSYTRTKGCHIIGWKWKLAAYRMKMWKKMQHTSPFCSNSKWHSVVCMTPMCLYTCLTMLGHSPQRDNGCCPGESPPTFGPGHHWASEQSEVQPGTCQMDQNIMPQRFPLGTPCLLWPYESRHCFEPRPTYDPYSSVGSNNGWRI